MSNYYRCAECGYIVEGFEASQQVRCCEHPGYTPVSHDYDKGLGIRGLDRYTEPVPTPTGEQIDRQIQRQAQARRCRSCGCSELEGAMFTTDPSSGLCDDCYGRER